LSLITRDGRMTQRPLGRALTCQIFNYPPTKIAARSDCRTVGVFKQLYTSRNIRPI